MKPARLLYALPALACAALLGFGYYLQYFDGQDPCPLCLVQRGFYYGVILVFIPAALHYPGRIGSRIYCAAGALFSLGGNDYFCSTNQFKLFFIMFRQIGVK